MPTSPLQNLPSQSPFTSLVSSSNVEYDLAVSTTVDNELIVHLTRDGRTWTGSYTQQYVEDITRKSGNFKKFAIFHTMLLQSLSPSPSLTLDVLTVSELMRLKSKSKSAQTKPPTKDDKRYMILTYIGEYDKVHYPLPLTEVTTIGGGEAREEVEVETGEAMNDMKMQVRLLEEDNEEKENELARLRELVDSQQQSLSTAAEEANPPSGELKQKNAELRRKLAKMEAKFVDEVRSNRGEIRELRGMLDSVKRGAQKKGEAPQPDVHAKNSALLKKLKSLSSQLRSERAAHQRTKQSATAKLGKMRSDISNLESTVAKLKQENSNLASQMNRKVNQKIARGSSKSNARVRNDSRSSSRANSRTTTPRGRRPGNSLYDRPTSSSRNSSRSSSRATSRASSRSSSRASSRSSTPTRSAGYGGGSGRFDPTAYQQEKARKEEERRRSRERRAMPSPSGSVRSLRSNESGTSRSRPTRRERKAKKNNKKQSARNYESESDSENHPPRVKNVAKAVTKAVNKVIQDAATIDANVEIEDINSRLQSLQNFINQANSES
ncbi:hypothetical protein TrVE_jg6085 [Triparma verrucosa]|uniref:Uncharacterized protein n=1 Tax=Triparma verrucosa TaxID=1606542 RepID=A0A9W7F3S6_9STRA|nr:hypothetical protein TrVE_jg6085 [Triparma verrucosa]